MAHTVEISNIKKGKALEAVRVDPREIMDDSKTFTRSNAYLYNGKEEQPMPGKWLDYGARFYDAQLGRWHSVDPLAEKHMDNTVYSYVLNNPIVNIDPNGLTDWNAIIKGSATFVGGAGSVIGGVAAASTPTGVGQIGGAMLITGGIPAMGLGIAKIVEGIKDDGSNKNVPGSVMESLGMAGDAVIGNDASQLQNAGTVLDIATNLSVGGIPKTVIEQGALAVEVISTGQAIVESIQNNNNSTSNSEHKLSQQTGVTIDKIQQIEQSVDNTSVVRNDALQNKLGTHSIQSTIIKEKR